MSQIKIELRENLTYVLTVPSTELVLTRRSLSDLIFLLEDVEEGRKDTNVLNLEEPRGAIGKPVQIEPWPNGGGLVCNEEVCPFDRECSCHRSAGDFRSESGFTPEVLYIDGKFYCNTMERPIDSAESVYGCPLPRGAATMGRGALKFVDGKVKPCVL